MHSGVNRSLMAADNHTYSVIANNAQYLRIARIQIAALILHYIKIYCGPRWMETRQSDSSSKSTKQLVLVVVHQKCGDEVSHIETYKGR
jgi:phosphatidylserine decarboxylase|eukprot:COSAG01_NODE_979_length_12356_cov_224.025618_9_plen_89_part_00